MKNVLKITGIIVLVLCGILLQGSSLEKSSVAAPTMQKWYFAEGRVGSGFKTFFTVGNPTNTTCSVKVSYYYTPDGTSGNNTKTVSFSVNSNSRYTVNANADLGISGASNLSAIISVDTGATPTCSGVVAERPMYFDDFHGTYSGTDVVGATKLNTKFYFSDIPDGSAGETFLSVFNPQNSVANVTATYFDPSTGNELKHETIAVNPTSRNTFQPDTENLPDHVTAVVTSDQSILVERPSYFPSQYGVAGASDVMGNSMPMAKWYFADGYTGSGAHEFLAITNTDDIDATDVKITLLTATGASGSSIAVATIKKNAQTIVDIDANNTTGYTQVGAVVESKNNIIVQREMYETYNGSTGWSAKSVTDQFGSSGSNSSYSFGEGFTSVGFDEWLILLNTSEGSQTINVTLTNMLGHTITRSYVVGQSSRFAVDITALVKSDLVQPGENAKAYAVSMTVQGNSSFVAERTMHWNAFGTQGAESVVGFSLDS